MIEVYDDEGDSSSKFMEAFRIYYMDNQFQEVFFYEDLQTKEEVFDGPRSRQFVTGGGMSN